MTRPPEQSLAARVGVCPAPMTEANNNFQPDTWATLEEIGAVLGISNQRADQIIRATARKLWRGSPVVRREKSRRTGAV